MPGAADKVIKYRMIQKVYFIFQYKYKSRLLKSFGLSVDTLFQQWRPLLGLSESVFPWLDVFPPHLLGTLKRHNVYPNHTCWPLGACVLASLGLKRWTIISTEHPGIIRSNTDALMQTKTACVLLRPLELTLTFHLIAYIFTVGERVS